MEYILGHFRTTVKFSGQRFKNFRSTIHYPDQSEFMAVDSHLLKCINVTGFALYAAINE